KLRDDAREEELSAIAALARTKWPPAALEQRATLNEEIGTAKNGLEVAAGKAKVEREELDTVKAPRLAKENLKKATEESQRATQRYLAAEELAKKKTPFGSWTPWVNEQEKQKAIKDLLELKKQIDEAKKKVTEADEAWQ